MELNYSQLKTQFIQYLISQNKLSGDISKLDPENISIFDYSAEFTEYLEEFTNLFSGDFNLDYSQIPDAIINQDIDDDFLAQMDEAINNPEMLLPTDDVAVDKTTTENPNEFVNEMLADVLKDEDVIKQLDADKTGDLSKEEIQSFIDFINKNDGDAENLTMEDIKKGLEQLKNNEYKADTLPEVEETPDVTTDDTNSTDTNNSSSPTNNSNNNNNNNNNNNSNTNNNNDNTKTQQKDYASMSFEQLTSERSTVEAEVKTAVDEVNKVHNGTNAAVATAEKDAAEKQAAYQEALKNDDKVSAELKENSLKNLDNISKKENEIDSLKVDLNNKDLAISQKTSDINEMNTTNTALQVAKSNLANQTSDDPEITKQIETKKKEVEDQIKTITKNLEKAQTELDNLEKEKNAIEKNIKTSEDDLKALNEEKSKIDAEILANCGEETKAALEAYNNAKANVETVKQAELEKANANLKTKQDTLAQIDASFHEKSASKVVKDNTVRDSKAVFDPSVELDFKYVPAQNGTMPYLMIGPKNVDPNAELPLLVYLHGSGEFGDPASTIESGVGPGNILRNWNLENFNGYIICPHSTGSFLMENWKGDDAVKNIRTLVDDFTSTHNVDSDRISIAGHSAGGIGAENIALSMPDVFKRVAVLSGYNTSKDISALDIEARGYVGTGDHQESKNYMNGKFQQEVGQGTVTVVEANHGDVPKAVFNLDADKDGRADILEFLFFAEDEK